MIWHLVWLCVGALVGACAMLFVVAVDKAAHEEDASYD